MFLKSYYWGYQLHSAEEGWKAWPLVPHSIKSSVPQGGIERAFGGSMEYIKCNVPAVHLEARLISGGKRVGILWPQDTFTTVQHYRNVPLENRPLLFHTQKFLVLYKCTWWLISHKCTPKFNAWPSAYLQHIHASVHVNKWLDGSGEKKRETDGIHI